ncbi:MAG: sel1 repeat family protein [Verrucomicrobiaceae bacterium]|nr:MAG: sel1 repeat family protein [Verrucomicrobiaceae bacterium]
MGRGFYDEIVAFAICGHSYILFCMTRPTLLLGCLILFPLVARSSDNAQTDYVRARNFLSGNGVAADPQKAYSLFQKAAESGDVEAKAALGYLSFTGKGTAKDEVKGIELLREAATAGSPKAAFNLAQIQMKNGRTYEALDFMTKAADGGMPEAEIVLADWYYFGQPGIDIDYKKAFEFYSRAAERGNPVAQNALGSIYYNGLGQARDRKKGVEYFRKAAERGVARAQVNLAKEYIMGDEVRRDKIEALKWLFQANAQGEVTARNTLKDFIRGVSQEQIEIALKETGLERDVALNLEN